MSGARKALMSGARDSLTKEKVTTFSIGQQKKTRFQKEREAAEARKKKEEAEAASVYDDFVASFGAGGGGAGGGRGDGGDPNAKTFMRGGVVNAGGQVPGPGGPSAAPAVYTLEARRPSKPMSDMERMLEEMKSKMSHGTSAVADGPLLPTPGRSGMGGPGAGPGQKRGSRHIDEFLEEIRGRVEGKPDSAPMVPTAAPAMAQRGPMDEGDPASTNLYLGNLAPSVTEETLQELFSRYGEIYSIKIMWPRTEEERIRRRNCGFVSFWRRQDAENAKNALTDELVEDYRMSIGWGKAINKLAHRIGDETRVSDEPPPPDVADPSLPRELLAQRDLIAKAQAAAKAAMAAAMAAVSGGGGAVAAPAAALLGTAAAAAPTGAPTSRWGTVPAAGGAEAAASSEASAGAAAAAAAGDGSGGFVQLSGIDQTAAGAATGMELVAPAPVATPAVEAETKEPVKVVIQAVEDRERRHFLDRLARYVAKDGALFEAKIREREAGNPEYAFLSTPEAPEGLYYRWRVFAFLMGDKEYRWRGEPFQMTPGGRLWVPPPPPEGADAEDPAERRRREEREKERKREREREEDKEREKAEAAKTKYMTGRQLEKARDRQRGRDRTRVLSDKDFEHFSELLRELTGSRRAIADAMAFALDHSDAAHELADVLKDALLVGETPLPTKVARLYLLSDILHNSSAPVRNASRYRTHLQAALPEVFEALNATLQGIEGRFTSRQLRERVMGLLSVWGAWSLYPPLFLAGLEATFLRQQGEVDAVDVGDVAEDDLDGEMLARRARMAGLATGGLAPMQLLRRLTHLNAYAKNKAAGRGPLEAPEPGTLVAKEEEAAAEGISSSSLAVSASGSFDSAAKVGPGGATGVVWSAKLAPEEHNSDSDVDGVPMEEVEDGNGGAATSAAGSAIAASADDSDDDIDGVPLPDGAGAAAPGSAVSSSGGDAAAAGMAEEKAERRRKKKKKRLERGGSRTWSGSDSDSGSGSGSDDDGGSSSASGGSGSGGGADVFVEEATRQAERRVGLLELTPAEEEQKRAMLRKVETDALQQRDKLEAAGFKEEEVKRKVDAKRGDAIAQWERELQKSRTRAAEAAAAAEEKKRKQEQRERERGSREGNDSRSSARRSLEQRSSVDRPRESRDSREGRDRSRERERDRSRERERERDRGRDRSREREKDKDKERSRGSGERTKSKDHEENGKNGSGSKKRSRNSRSKSKERSGSRRSKRSRSRSRSRSRERHRR